ncbi:MULTISPECIES: acyl-CoA dehydrogenase family protein [unclassified Streptomyces]|uniref:acyl-CoA dehydrogenase family protein n=1 Tax=unclassified Streptomyces TaxID=2593676 RepID=UPI001BED3654|nr:MULTISPECIES: acyl-CoA dehydrogenase family protein [unclassified Streptomyces]MBT2408585.1 acyl-CoA dehydrogenase family protein [Streptomyces sp. ISL-21]MBT2608731.1 acyl-CoA dehydrogenase family protein [Streptomyces sp. ISL-87]
MTNAYQQEADLVRFASRVVAPRAAESDRSATLDRAVIDELAASGLLGAAIPKDHGGLGFTDTHFGELCAAVGAWCTSTRALLTVQDMVAGALLRSGSRAQQEKWLPRLARGEAIAAFALTEPDAGSDAAAVAAPLTEAGDGWLLDGTKRWVSFGAIADVCLVVARAAGGPTAVLVERGAAGMSVEPIGARSLGMRAAMTANMTFESCVVGPENIVGAVGAGFTFVAGTALDRGRHSVAWGSAGLAEGVLREATRHASRRRQFGAVLTDHQLIRALLSDMLVRARSARLACRAAAEARERRDADATLDTVLAKYTSARTAFDNAAAAVQVLGSRACESGTLVERMYRDAKVQQLIEGTDQLAQLQLWELAVRDERRHDRVVAS